MFTQVATLHHYPKLIQLPDARFMLAQEPQLLFIGLKDLFCALNMLIDGLTTNLKFTSDFSKEKSSWK